MSARVALTASSLVRPRCCAAADSAALYKIERVGQLYLIVGVVTMLEETVLAVSLKQRFAHVLIAEYEMCYPHG